MLIRTQQWLIAAAATLTVAAIAWAWTESSAGFRLELERNQLAKQIWEVGTARLRLHTFTFLDTASIEAQIDWRESHAELTRLLETRLFKGAPGAAILAGLHQHHAVLPDVFDTLVEYRTAKSVNWILDPDAQAHQRELTRRIVTLTQHIAEGSSTLMDLSQQRLEALQRQQEKLMLGLIFALALAIGLNFAIVRHQILKPARRLEQGARAIEAGHYDHRIGLQRANELGALAREFDHMAESLSATMAALRQQGSQLALANRELESFSYSVSHDLRTPLRGIEGWTRALLEDCGERLDTSGREYLDRVRAECARMNLLIEDLLQLARVSRGELDHERVDLPLLARQVAARSLEACRGRDIGIEIQPGISAWGDRRLLEIALTNLFDNACKFSARVPQARIAFGRCLAENPATRQCEEAFFVRDNGAGFDMAHAQRLFGAFQRMHSEKEFPGTGIGLAIVQRIVLRHGGHIWAEAERGRGACFFFTLPPGPGPGPGPAPVAVRCAGGHG
ncbi:HAMP domain-containing histidine kinase [Thauera aromatica]|nr:HAMP domain-containing histidine kinase [Thauera aromatica]